MSGWIDFKRTASRIPLQRSGIQMRLRKYEIGGNKWHGE